MILVAYPCMASPVGRGRGGMVSRDAAPLMPMIDEAQPSCIRCLEASSDHPGHLVEVRRGNREADGLGGLEVDDQLERGGLLDRQVARCGPL
jgi:hypothetical protein